MFYLLYYCFYFHICYVLNQIVYKGLCILLDSCLWWSSFDSIYNRKMAEGKDKVIFKISQGVTRINQLNKSVVKPVHHLPDLFRLRAQPLLPPKLLVSCALASLTLKWFKETIVQTYNTLTICCVFLLFCSSWTYSFRVLCMCVYIHKYIYT